MSRFLLLLLTFWLMLTGSCLSQPSTADEPSGQSTSSLSPDLDRARRNMEFAQRYRAVCDDVRALDPKKSTPQTSVLADFRQDGNFISAIATYCAFGDFNYDESAHDNSCSKRYVLAARHLEFIRNITLVRTEQPVRRIAFRCVEFPEAMVLRNLVGSLQFTDVTAERMLVAFSNLPMGLTAKNSTFRRGFAVYASDVGALFQFENSRAGSNDTWNMALGTESSAFNEIEIRGATIEGPLKFGKLVTAKSLRIFGKTTIDGQLRMTDARVGSHLELGNIIAKDEAYLDYVSALRLTITNSEFEKRLFVDHAKIDREIAIKSSKLNRGMYGAFINVPDLELSENRTGGSIDLSYAQAGSMLAYQTTRNAEPCAGCDLIMYNTIIGSLRVRESDLSRVLAGNSRFHTAVFSRGTIGILSCEDCLVDQYVLLAVKIRERADLKGAEIKGTLAFSEGPSRVCWGNGSILDMAELKADVLAINARDLVIEPTRNPNTDCVSPEQDAQAAFVPSKLTGARYRTITGGRVSMDARTDPDAAIRKAAVLPTATDISEERLIGFVRGYKAIADVGYDPQPYEEMAAALARAGETEKAVTLRVARIDERIANTGVGWLERGWFWIYKQLSDYGYKNERTAKAFCLLLLLGTIIHQWGTGMLAAHVAGPLQFTPLLGSLLYSFWFSLDRAIPPLNLELMKKEDLTLPWGTLNYFYLHRVFGTGLISVFAAGAAGLGQ